MPTIALTDRKIAGLKPRPERPEYFDRALPGFGVRLSVDGRKVSCPATMPFGVVIDTERPGAPLHEERVPTPRGADPIVESIVDLAGRLTDTHHQHHDLTLATQHVHLDHDNCLETVMLRGPVAAVRAFAEAIIVERGVRHGKLHMIPVQRADEHSHGTGRHTHDRPAI